MILVNGAQAGNVFWQANGAAGTGAGSTFVGTILAFGAITIGAGTHVIGRALTLQAVTLASNIFDEAPGTTLSISVPTDSLDLGTRRNTVQGGTITGSLGSVEVDDTCNAAPCAGWVATVAMSDFTSTPAGSIPAGLIPASGVTYDTGGIVLVGGGTGAAAKGQVLSGLSTTPQSVVTATAITGPNQATWNPTISVTLPGGLPVGVYTATVTHSVL